MGGPQTLASSLTMDPGTLPSAQAPILSAEMGGHGQRMNEPSEAKVEGIPIGLPDLALFPSPGYPEDQAL